MANLPESSVWEDVYQIETTDLVLGGSDGTTNVPLKNLTNRTKYLKDYVDSLNSATGTFITATNTRLDDLEGANDTTQVTLANHEDRIIELEHAVNSIKHGVISARESSTGPSFITGTIAPGNTNLTINASISDPFIATISCGYLNTGKSDKYFYIDSNVTVTSTTSSASKLLVLNNNGTFSIIDGSTFDICYATPVSPAIGALWYKLGTERMYRYNGTAWATYDVLVVALISESFGIFTYFNIGRGMKETYGRSSVPAGTVHTFAGPVSKIPAGFLLANGGQISRVAYRELFIAIGTTYGSGDGSTTFNLPDLRAQFIRGLDNSLGIDTDNFTAIGSITSGSNTITGITTVGIFPGMTVTGTGIPAGTTVTAIVSRTVIGISANATATTAGVTLTFSKTRTLGSMQDGSIQRHEHFYASQANVVNSTSPTTATLIDWDGATQAQRFAGNTEYVGGSETRPMNIAMNFIIKY